MFSICISILILSRIYFNEIYCNNKNVSDFNILKYQKQNNEKLIIDNENGMKGIIC